MSERDSHSVFLSGVSDVDVWEALSVLPGFVTVRTLPGQPGSAVADFADHPAAVAALRSLDGSLGYGVQVQLACSNSDGIFHRQRPSSSFRSGGRFVGKRSAAAAAAAIAPQPQQHFATLAATLMATDGAATATATADGEGTASEAVVREVVDLLSANVRGCNPPCSTLFVGNVADCALDTDLDAVFSQFPGFLKARMGARDITSRRRVAFLDFRTAHFSTMAMCCAQGMLFPPTAPAGRKPLRIEFAKQRMVSYRPAGPPSFDEL